MQIIDDFLPENQFLEIQKALLSANFPWYYANSVVSKDLDLLCDEKYNYQFGHSFYRDYTFQSEYAKLLFPILERLQPIAITRIKGILLPRTEETVTHGYHIDNPYNTKVAIYYVNTNNGYTKFAEGPTVDSISNRIVIFNSDEYHTGATCTDEKVRVAINFNYF